MSKLAPDVAADTQAPPEPTNLRIVSLSFTSVSLAWNPVVDNSGWVEYEVEVAALPRSMLRYASITSGKTVDGLVPGLGYTASVVAVDGARNRSAPVSVRFTTPVDSTPPSTPSFLRAVTVDGRLDSITWGASTDASPVRYILRSGGNFVFGTTGTRVTAQELLFLDCVVRPGSTHSLTVEAHDAHDNVSDHTIPVTVTFPSRP
jgi:hypothetical protein